jgi:hypothetical protein
MHFINEIAIVIKATIPIFQIANWTPEYYNSTSELPVDMPANLKKRIAEYYGIYRSLVRL